MKNLIETLAELSLRKAIAGTYYRRF